MPSAFPTTNTQEADDVPEIIIRIRNCQRQEKESTAKRRREFFRLITGMLTIAIISASFLFVGMPADRSMAKKNQEINVAWKR